MPPRGRGNSGGGRGPNQGGPGRGNNRARGQQVANFGSVGVLGGYPSPLNGYGSPFIPLGNARAGGAAAAAPPAVLNDPLRSLSTTVDWDFSDTTRMFSDFTGTTPTAADGNPAPSIYDQTDTHLLVSNNSQEPARRDVESGIWEDRQRMANSDAVVIGVFNSGIGRARLNINWRALAGEPVLGIYQNSANYGYLIGNADGSLDFIHSDGTTISTATGLISTGTYYSVSLEVDDDGFYIGLDGFYRAVGAYSGSRISVTEFYYNAGRTTVFIEGADHFARELLLESG